jgi:hypothetical protein
MSVGSPYKIFTDIDGQPLDDGYVFIGVAGLNPQTNPITVFSDPALTLPVAAADQDQRWLSSFGWNPSTTLYAWRLLDHSVEQEWNACFHSLQNNVNDGAISTVNECNRKRRDRQLLLCQVSLLLCTSTGFIRTRTPTR